MGVSGRRQEDGGAEAREAPRRIVLPRAETCRRRFVARPPGGPSTRVAPRVDRLIKRSIAERKLLRFELNGFVRIAEPHEYGVLNGKPKLLVYQIGGESQSGRIPDWRWVDLSSAAGFRAVDCPFARRSRATRPHADWDELFASVRLG